MVRELIYNFLLTSKNRRNWFYLNRRMWQSNADQHGELKVYERLHSISFSLFVDVLFSIL